jgi:predicted permease
MGASNTGFIGLSIATQFFGPQVGVAVAMTFLVENLLMLPGLIILGHEPDGASGRVAMAKQIGRGLVRSPLVIGISGGLVALLLGVQPIAPLAKALDMLAAASAPVALIAIGGSLVGLNPRGMASAVSVITVGKLILHPLAVFLLLMLVPIANPVLRHGALLLAAVPMAGSYPIFGQRFREGPLASATLLVATATSFLTLNLVLWLIVTGRIG